jgi:release factor glutamine methyltransferase
VQFREIELGVDPRALIPRPETEVLVGVVLDWTRARARDDLRALDVGTGTGAIALSLLAEQGVAQAVATDVSAGALALAAENAARLGLAGRLELRAGSVYAAVGPDERFDVIVSNPPYIAAAERATLATEVVDWEPESALFGGVRGLDVVEPIVRGALDRLARPGLLALELAPQQTAEVAELARACGFANVRIIEDLAGRARIVAAEAG